VGERVGERIRAVDRYRRHHLGARFCEQDVTPGVVGPVELGEAIQRVGILFCRCSNDDVFVHASETLGGPDV